MMMTRMVGSRYKNSNRKKKIVEKKEEHDDNDNVIDGRSHHDYNVIGRPEAKVTTTKKTAEKKLKLRTTTVCSSTRTMMIAGDSERACQHPQSAVCSSRRHSSSHYSVDGGKGSLTDLDPTSSGVGGASAEVVVDNHGGRSTGGTSVGSTTTGTGAGSSNNTMILLLLSSRIVIMFVFLIGAIASFAVLYFGIDSARMDECIKFEQLANDIVSQFKYTMDEYFLVGLFIHHAMTVHNINNNKQVGTDNPVVDDGRHDAFRVVYEYLRSSNDLIIDGAAWMLNISNDERIVREEETRLHLNKLYPDHIYPGFIGLEGTFIWPDKPPPTIRSEQSSYMSLHCVEPLENPMLRNLIDFDSYSDPIHRRAIIDAQKTQLPTLTADMEIRYFDPRLKESFVGIVHPGPIIESYNNTPSKHFAALLIRVNSIMTGPRLSTLSREENVKLFVYDSTDIHQQNDDDDHTQQPQQQQQQQPPPPPPPTFLAAAEFPATGSTNSHNPQQQEQQQEQEQSDVILISDRIPIYDVYDQKYRYQYEKQLSIASRQWTFIVVSDYPSFQPDPTYVIIGAFIVMIATCLLAMLIHGTAKRTNKLNELQNAAETEKTSLLIQTAKRMAKRERELNDFIAHEVRNPLSAAISACSFVTSAINGDDDDDDNDNSNNNNNNNDRRAMMQEDLTVIHNCLQFMNDLLRNMLDINKASSKQLKLVYEPTDILHDVLEQACAMLYHRGVNFNVELHCPPGLVVLTDRLRLKQIILNLGRNSEKFVTNGYIRFGACIQEKQHQQQHNCNNDNDNDDDNNNNNNNVILYVEDSGPGIPIDKRKRLFSKFQESLDTLNQGTGIGLSLCKSLTELLGGEIWLDESYKSDVEGCIGTRFVVNLKTSPMTNNEMRDALSATVKHHTDDDDSGHFYRPSTSRLLPATTTTTTTETTTMVLQEQQHHYHDEETTVTPDETHDNDNYDRCISSSGSGSSKSIVVLPESLSILFVDDDFILRKMFVRCIRKACPNGWIIHEAASGEAALQAIESTIATSNKNINEDDDDDDDNENDGVDAAKKCRQQQQQHKNYDIIFIDQYMASSDKQLLGTETVRELRSRGYKEPIVCGLSANELEEQFLLAGADTFCLKPFPCKTDAIQQELYRILHMRQQQRHRQTTSR